MKTYGAKVYKFKIGIEDLLSSVCNSQLYTMKLNLLESLLEDDRKFGDISNFDDTIYEQFNSHNKKAY